MLAVNRLAYSILLLILVSNPLESTQKAHIVESDSETLWIGRFAHCDYGFYVLLPDGMVAHSTLPPNPVHGFTVALPNVSSRSTVSTDDSRFIWVNAEYNASDAATAKQTIAFYKDLIGRDKPGRKVTLEPATLGSLRAMRLLAEYDGTAGKIIEEEVIAVRKNIVYEIGLRTTKAAYGQDRLQFERVLAGFRVWRIHYC